MKRLRKLFQVITIAAITILLPFSFYAQTDSCQIYDLQVYDIECSSDSTYLISINFLYDSVSQELFTVKDRNGIIGDFAYDSLPLRLELSISGFEYELVRVEDLNNPDCFDLTEFMVNCAPECSISNLSFTNIECNSDSTFLVTINFDFENVANNFFDLSDRNGIIGFFAYDSLPIRTEVPISGLPYEFLKVSDNDNPDCYSADEFMVNCTPECTISNLSFTNIECNSDSTFLVTIDFNHENVFNDFFDLSDRNGIIGFFAYDSLPIRTEVPISGLDYEFLKVSDNDNPDCSAAEEFMVNCAPECSISNLSFTNIECNSDSTFLVTINFDFDNVTNDFFDLSDRNGIIGFFAYDSLPIRTEVPISGLDYEFLKVSDNDNPDCYSADEFMVNCTSNQSTAHDQSAFKVWPNPVQQILNIASEESFEYSIFNTNGYTIMQGTKKLRTELEVENLPSGIYFLHLRSNDKRAEFTIIKM